MGSGVFTDAYNSAMCFVVSAMPAFVSWRSKSLPEVRRIASHPIPPLRLGMKMLLPALLLKCGRVECLEWDWSGARFVARKVWDHTSEAALPVDFGAP